MNELEAVDRRALAREAAPKPSKWPRTDRRQARLASVLDRRQPDLTVVLENVHDPHNVSAVLRSCDAVGIMTVHTVYDVETAPKKAYARRTSGSAAKWIDIVRHETIADCYSHLRERGHAVFAAALGRQSASLYDVDFTLPIAIVFGNEMRGVSEEGIALADGCLKIPMQGMIESLNISVACAVTMYEAMRQRLAAGRYAESALSEPVRAEILESWLKR